VDKSGGLQALPSHLVQVTLDVDLGQTFSEIRRPTLMLASHYEPVPPLPTGSDTSIEWRPQINLIRCQAFGLTHF
jgi:hypothetical protein